MAHPRMVRIHDKTDDRLTLVDDQSDKKLALKLAGGFVFLVCVFLVWEGFWEMLVPGAATIAGMIFYAKWSAMTSTLVFDRTGDHVSLIVEDRTGLQDWEWRLSDILTAEVDLRGRDGMDSGISRPDLILKDGTRAPMRPYHSAGTQSWHAVAAVQLFLGQPLTDAPIGWIPPEEFDRYFPDEMARFSNKE